MMMPRFSSQLLSWNAARRFPAVTRSLQKRWQGNGTNSGQQSTGGNKPPVFQEPIRVGSWNRFMRRSVNTKPNRHQRGDFIVMRFDADLKFLLGHISRLQLEKIILLNLCECLWNLNIFSPSLGERLRCPRCSQSAVSIT